MVIAFYLTDVFANPGSVFKMVLMSQSEVFSSGKNQNWILAVDFLHKKCQFEPRYTDGHGCTIWKYRGGGGIHPVDGLSLQPDP